MLSRLTTTLTAKLKSGIASALEAIPLPIFLIYSRLIEPYPEENWIGPYLSSSIAAAIVTAFLIAQKKPLNRCFIGINLYFVIGCIGVLTHQSWLNQLLGELKASAMLISITVAGLYCSYFSSLGFIGCACDDKAKLRIYSLSLTVIAAVATAISYAAYNTHPLMNNILFTELIPFIALFTAQNRFKAKLAQG